MKQSRRGTIPAFRIMASLRDANALARAGKDMIHLSLGQPSQEVPAKVLSRLAEVMPKSKLGYTESTGMIELRERISKLYRDKYQLSIPVERIFITLGSSSAFIMALLAAFDENDRVAIAEPCYPAYPNIMRAMNCEPVFLRAGLETKFQPTVSMLQALKQQPEGLILASPSNPTGTILSSAEQKLLADYCQANEIRIIADEIYHGISYTGACDTILRHTDSAFVVNSFSKYYLMPGWRLGWAVVPTDLVHSFEALAQNLFLSPSAVSQYAALLVMECEEELTAVVKSYAKNRAILLEELPKLGITKMAPPEGAFFIYADVSHLTNDSEQFCQRMLHEAGVVSVSGRDFDAAEGHRYVRFSFSGSEAHMREGMKRLGNWLKK